MDKKTIFNKKEAVKATAVIFLICSMTAFVPTINGHVTKNILENDYNIKKENENNIYSLFQNPDSISLQDIVDILENTEIENNKFFSSMIKKIVSIVKHNFPLNSIEIPTDLLSYYEKYLFQGQSKTELLEVIKEKIIPLHNEVYEFINGKKNIEEISSELENLILKFGNNNYTSSLKENSLTDFQEYWKNYEEALALWQTDTSEFPDYPWLKILDLLRFFSQDNYVDWWYQYATVDDAIVLMSAFLIGVGSLILGISSPVGLGIVTSAIGTLMIIIGSTIGIGFASYIYFTLNSFISLQDKEIDIHIRLIDYDTKKGIENLHLNPNYLKARNENAIFECINDSEPPGKEVEDFIYILKPNYEIKENETGWYSLSMRADNFDDKYIKPPCPPGNWTLELFADNYVFVENDESIIEIPIYEIPTGGTVIFAPIELIKEQ